MSEEAEIRTLLGELEKSRNVLGRVALFRADYQARIAGQPQATDQAIVLSDLVVTYYTCLETLFLRISQVFENRLSPQKWQADLLHRMTIRVEGIREAVVADETAALLAELLKFRHFKRYYFDLEYDWDRVEFVLKKLDQARPLLDRDLNRFTAFLRSLLENSR
jgi:hypothetical protein